MRIYLASRYSRIREMNVYRAELEAAGHKIWSRWINGNHQIDDGPRFAQEDRDDIFGADCVVSFTEQPRSLSNSRGGRHVELGMALAFRKRVVVVGHRENVFHYLPEVEFFGTWEEARAALAVSHD